MKILKSNLSKREGVKLIWNQTHNDYKGKLDGDYSIMVDAGDGGGICVISKLGDDLFDKYLERAIDTKNREICKDLALKVFKKHEDVFGALGLTQKDCGTINQCCGDFKGIRSLVRDLSKYDASGVFNEKVLTDINSSIDYFERQYEKKDSGVSLTR